MAAFGSCCSETMRRSSAARSVAAACAGAWRRLRCSVARSFNSVWRYVWHARSRGRSRCRVGRDARAKRATANPFARARSRTRPRASVVTSTDAGRQVRREHVPRRTEVRTVNDDAMSPGRYWTDGSRLLRHEPTPGQQPLDGLVERKDCHALDRLLLCREDLARIHRVSRPGAPHAAQSWSPPGSRAA